MNVRELISILEKCDPEMPIAAHANNHTTYAGRGDWIRVALLHTYTGKHIVIGNLSKRRTNYPNDYVEVELDNRPSLPEEWR